MKLKIGDKVKVVGPSSFGCPRIGEIGVVQSIRHHYIFPYRVKLNLGWREFRGRELEKVE